MYTYSKLSALLLAAINIPSARADSCYAVGSLNTNSEGFGPGGTTYAGGQSLTLYNSNDEMIGSYDLCDTCSGVCSDFISVPTGNLSQVFEWGASCGNGNFDECHGAYGDQTHIEGEEPQSGTDFYGLGIDATSECRVNFDC
ncbi:hypothetical protein N7532_003545 [Penicillium argentinense]|uniref:Uncharacterized protein n=1 Tax=Penicillium argentinense TaxID=1131581 RepID=A0A9W9FMM8_9EURO|nr:uncharacterized protein N7532_003545 [Penicillium argentinense]KAJ5103016.1 hypothetical protein N7532_003545 [Penicillium argentinense]